MRNGQAISEHYAHTLGTPIRQSATDNKYLHEFIFRNKKKMPIIAAISVHLSSLSWHCYTYHGRNR